MTQTQEIKKALESSILNESTLYLTVRFKAETKCRRFTMRKGEEMTSQIVYKGELYDTCNAYHLFEALKNKETTFYFDRSCVPVQNVELIKLSTSPI